ncbi:diguanylate cyclase [Martelella alba]|uniref:Diguanylate cyclase n=1 Tax=Martelella alba TaxID=2590451 RepID=A0A506UD60_9HYPH|nr:sensor domain-containing diguanylate cyclase [Martelella alba]TPW29677.1 diguanylate cyclase [Martelella alba]
MRELFERAQHGTHASQRDLHIILDALPIPISWAYTSSGEIQFVNLAFKQLFGYRDDSFKTVADWIENSYVKESDRKLTRQRWQDIWQPAGVGISEVLPIELDVRCADGSIVTVIHRGTLLHDIGIAIATFEDFTAQKRAEEALHRLSFEDPLTGAGNRRALQMQWEKETSARLGDQTLPLTVLMLDLDGFKAVNDSLGHDIGDSILIETARRIQQSLQANGALFRFGGDEFVVLLTGLVTAKEVEFQCTHIKQAISAPFKHVSDHIRLGMTIGISQWPEDGPNLSDVLKKADQALYSMKKTNKGGWQWHAQPQSNH